MLRKTHETLRYDEVIPLLRHVPKPWRALVAAALMDGARKGELFGLKKRDIDLGAKLMVIARSK